MDWLINLFVDNESMAHIAMLYAVVIATGVYLGKLKVGGISLGVTFVLFAGILAGHLGFTAPLSTLSFVQDFGLILFVFMIGLQVGPGFFSSFKEGGLKLNMLAVSLILLNILVMFGCYYAFFDTTNPENLPMMIGTLYGAVTNTPGLGAAQEALMSIMGNSTPAIANGYACAYPLGVVGIIVATIAVRYICGVKISEEEKELESHDNDLTQVPYLMHLIVQNQFVAGHTILELHDFMRRDYVCSRILRNGELIFPKSSTTLELGDKVFIVCSEADKDAVQAFIGKETIVPEFAEQEKQKQLVSRRIVITKPEINGKTPAKLHFASVYGVNLTRVTRQGMEIFARQDLPLQVGDRVMVVGDQVSVNRVSSVLGNAVKRLDNPNIATIFVGIILGLILGSIPFTFPEIPVPLKLGLAGGPLIVAILIGRYGYKIHLVTYTTTSANLMLREIGLVLFLASVGVKAGANFVDTVVNGDGLLYVLTGFMITVLPILIIGIVARKKYHFNYFTIMGLLAGATTDPPALAFANASCSKDAPSIGYSTVYPLSMFLRIFTAQLIVLLFCS
ncbi:MAG: putative transporter [Prevotella sp.]|nr:putative transporter [Prevotella sp.]